MGTLKFRGAKKKKDVLAELSPAGRQRVWGLAAGGGIGKARTGGELPKSCEVSHETTPRLTPNPSLGVRQCVLRYTGYKDNKSSLKW